jgi:plasmid stabilization system protein ParE
VGNRALSTLHKGHVGTRSPSIPHLKRRAVPRRIEEGPRLAVAQSRRSELLLHTPGMGSHRGFYNPALDDLRMMRLHNFTNYLIFYRLPREEKKEKIEIIRVIHGARDLPTLFE